MTDARAWQVPGRPELLGPPWGEEVEPGVPWAKDPSVVRFGDRYLLYYSRSPSRGRDAQGWSIGIAESEDLVSWQRIGVLEPFGDYDAKGLCAAGAIVLADRVHLFFQTYGNWATDAICHASSPDGVHFEPNPENPVFAPSGAWTCGRAIDADVVQVGDRLLLAYATRDPSMTVQLIGTASAAVGSGFGRAAWTHLSPDGPALAPTLDWEQDCVEAPALRYDGETVTMFYAGAYNNAPQQIGWATSTDGVTWTRGSEQPILPCGGPGEWNSSESGHPGFLRDDDGQGYLFFQGNPDGGATWLIAGTRVDFDGPRPVIRLQEG